MSTVIQLDDDYLNHSKERIELLRNAIKTGNNCPVCFCISSFESAPIFQGPKEIGEVTFCKICHYEKERELYEV